MRELVESGGREDDREEEEGDEGEEREPDHETPDTPQHEDPGEGEEAGTEEVESDDPAGLGEVTEDVVHDASHGLQPSQSL